MSTSAYFDKDTEKYLVEGLNLVANAVKSTLGPAGNTVVIATDSADSTAAGKDTYYYVVVEYVNNTDAAEDSASQNEDFGAQLQGDISVELAA